MPEEKNEQQPTNAGPYFELDQEHEKISHLTETKSEQMKLDTALGLQKAGAAALEDNIAQPITVLPQAMEPTGEIHPEVTDFMEYKKRKLEDEYVQNNLNKEDIILSTTKPKRNVFTVIRNFVKKEELPNAA